MAKRELSTTLRNLKFMQRAGHKEELKPKEEEKAKPDESFSTPSAASSVPLKRCIVIMEGNPHPGALRGRMSFQSFNPSIDKLHEEATIVRQVQASNISRQNGSSGGIDEISAMRSEDSNVTSPSSDSDIDLNKRKQPELDMKSPSPQKAQKIESGDGSSQSTSRSNPRGSYKQKRERLNWNVLRPPKAQNRS